MALSNVLIYQRFICRVVAAAFFVVDGVALDDTTWFV